MFWVWFHKRFGNPNITKLNFSMGLLSRFDYHYFLYDESGDVKDGARTMVSAIRKAKKQNLYVSRCWD